MEKIFLVFRQRKLLYILQHRTGLTTGAELAKQLGTTARTIRSDVASINRSLEPFHIKIESFRSKGYRLVTEDTAMVKHLLQAETAFLTKEDRFRYLAFQLCLADDPIRTEELEDEMFISHGTLENDLQNLTEKYVTGGPKITLMRQNNLISFEKDERKRRMILSELYYEHWNYNERSNAFYGYDFIDEARLEQIINLVSPILHKHGIRMEDSNIVNLNLVCAIMLERLASGHPLAPRMPIPQHDAAAGAAAAELTDALEQRFRCEIPAQERDELCLIIGSGKLPYPDGLNLETARELFDPLVCRMTDAYLASIKASFGLDFLQDEDFYITLLQLVNYLQSPVRIFNNAENPELVKQTLLTELELAWQFQRVSKEHTNRYLSGAELLTLAECLSGAMEFQFRAHPEVKARAVICCHLPMAVAWAVKRKILGIFDRDLDIYAIIPVNAKSAFDFGDADLILSTVRKPIVRDPSADVIQISPQVTPEDIQAIEVYIRQRRMRKLFPSAECELGALFASALWYEDMEFRDVSQAVRFSAEALVQSGIADMRFAEDVEHRLSLKFHALEPGILFLPSTEPARETRLSIVLMKHRLLLKKCKIRAVITGAFRERERALIFHLAGFFHRKNQSVRSFGEIRSKEDFLSLFSETDEYSIPLLPHEILDRYVNSQLAKGALQ